MKFGLMIALFLLGSNAGAAGRSYTDFPELTQLLEKMSLVAGDGASLLHFGFEERMPARPVTCSSRALTSQEVADHVIELADQILGVGEDEGLKAPARPQLLALLGSGPFRACSFLGQVRGAWTEISVFIGPDYLFHTELASED